MASSPGRPLRVLFVDTVPRLSGAEQSLADMVERLGDVGIEPVVCLPSEGPLSHRLRAQGVLVRTIKIDERLLTVSRGALAAKPWIVVTRLMSLITAGRRLRKLIKEVGPMVVHSNTLKAHLLCILPCLRTRTPLIWHVRDILPRNWVSAAFIWAARFANVILVPSRAVAEPFRLSKKVFRKVRLVPNGIRAQDFIDARADRSLRDEIGAGKRDLVVGIVGRIAPWKGQEVFLRAAAMLAPRHPNVRFAVFGAVLFPENDAPFDGYLRRLAVDLRLEDRLAFLGHRPAPEAMAACDVIVHCSLEPEPFGRVIAEGMAAGLPVVAAAGGATAEILPPAAGFIVPPGRPELLADALDRLLNDRELREHMGETGEDVATSFFDLERVVHSVAQIHRALAARNARRRRRARQTAVKKVAKRVPRPTRVRKTRAQHQLHLPKHGWHRDTRGRWVPPVDAAEPWAGEATAWEQPIAPHLGSEEEEIYEDVIETDDDSSEWGDAELEAVVDEPEASYDEEDDEPEALYDEEDDDDEWVETGPTPGAVWPPSAPTSSELKPAGVAILDIAAPVRARKRSVPTSVAGGQTGVVARVTAAPQVTLSAPAYQMGYPLAPTTERKVAPKPHFGYNVLKRTTDLLGVLVVLVIGSPLWIGIALAIKLGSSGPVFHRGTVHGVGGKAFTYYKFRTMRIGSSDVEHRRFIERYVLENGGHDDGGEVVYKLTGDNRVTPIGRILRRLSLDEIPQLLNVLRGQMSLVGPRPPLDYEYELYDERAMQRLSVRPGITGLQQVWARNMASFEDKLRMDLNYIRERSIWMDLKLLLHTIPSAVRGH